MPDSSVKRDWWPIGVAIFFGLVSVLWLYLQLRVWKEEGHDQVLTAANIAVTLLLWFGLALALYMNIRDLNRAKALHAQIVTIKEDYESQISSLKELHAANQRHWEHAGTYASSPEGDKAAALALAGKLCAFLMENGEEVGSPYMAESDPFAGLGDRRVDPIISAGFPDSLNKELDEFRERLASRGLLAVEFKFSSIGDVLNRPEIQNADDVFTLIKCLDQAARTIDEKFIKGTPFALARRPRQRTSLARPVTESPLDPSDGLFSPLQGKAIRLARRLRDLAGKGLVGCPEEEFNRTRLEYEKTFAPQVKALMYEFAEEGAGENSTLRRFSEFADNGNNILNVARELIRLAFIQDGIDVEVRYPS
jgi:hypothetical protein